DTIENIKTIVETNKGVLLQKDAPNGQWVNSLPSFVEFVINTKTLNFETISKLINDFNVVNKSSVVVTTDNYGTQKTLILEDKKVNGENITLLLKTEDDSPLWNKPIVKILHYNSAPFDDYEVPQKPINIDAELIKENRLPRRLYTT